VVLADGIQPYVAPVFDADAAYALTRTGSLGGVLAYTLQILFRFLRVLDMALGCRSSLTSICR